MMFDVLWPHLKLDVSHYQVDWISYHLFWNADCFDLKTHFIKYRILLRQCELSIWLLANDSISYSTVLFECNLHCCRVSWINITSEMNETLSFTLINCISISIISNLLHSTCWWISIKQCSKKKKTVHNSSIESVLYPTDTNDKTENIHHSEMTTTMLYVPLLQW